MRGSLAGWAGRVVGAMALAAIIAAQAGGPARADDIPPELSLKGKTIGITVIGTDHYWDLKAYQGQVDEVKRLGGTAVALDGGRKDNQQIAQIQTLIAQKPDAIIEQPTILGSTLVGTEQ